MSQSNTTIKTQAYQLIVWQLFVIVGIALILLLLQGIQQSWSALLGGLAYCLPNLFFVWRLFSYANVRTALRFVIAFFAGEVAKLTFSGILFVLIIKFLPVSSLSVLIGFLGAIISFWLISIIYLFRHQEGGFR